MHAYCILHTSAYCTTIIHDLILHGIGLCQMLSRTSRSLSEMHAVGVTRQLRLGAPEILRKAEGSIHREANKLLIYTDMMLLFFFELLTRALILANEINGWYNKSGSFFLNCSREDPGYWYLAGGIKSHSGTRATGIHAWNPWIACLCQIICN